MTGLLQTARRAKSAIRRRVLEPYSVYSRTSRFLAKSDRWDAATIADWQLRQLNAIVQHATRNCPGYRRKFDGVGLKGPLRSLDALAGIPFLTKDELRSENHGLTATNFAADKLMPVTSGGTTGTPTRFMVDARSYDDVFSAWRHSMWRRAGFAPGKRCLDLTWAFVKGAPLIETAANSRLMLSIHALNIGELDGWLQRVIAFKPEFIVGFPSTAVALAKIIPEPKLLPNVSAFLLASETLTEDQRSVLVSAFPNARIFEWYGMSELAGFASGCEFSDEFHHWPQSSIMELVDDAGQTVRKAGEVGEITLTSFLNRATPFIRFRTGDRAVLGTACTHCGRPHTILTKIMGRVNDFLVGAGGRHVPLSALNFHSDEFQHVMAHQFIQEEPGRVILSLVALPSFRKFHEDAIRGMIVEKLGADITLTVQRVSSIPRTARGKQPLIIQRCPDAMADTKSNSGYGAP